MSNKGHSAAPASQVFPPARAEGAKPPVTALEPSAVITTIDVEPARVILQYLTMLAALSSSALAFTAPPLSAATTHASRAAQMSPGPSMLDTFTTSGVQTEYVEEPTAAEWKSRIGDALRRLYPGRGLSLIHI